MEQWGGKPPTKPQDQGGIQGLLGTQNEEQLHEIRDRDKSLPGAPGDFALFDFSEMENLGNQLFNAQDTWVRKSPPPPQFRYSGFLTTEQQKVEEWWQKNTPPVAEVIHTFVKNRMSIADHEEDFDQRMRGALNFLRENGTARGIQLADSGLLGLGSIVEEQEMITENLAGKQKASIFLGPVFDMEDCSPQDIRIGNLHFTAVDYGDELRLTEALQRSLITGEVWGGTNAQSSHTRQEWGGNLRDARVAILDGSVLN